MSTSSTERQEGGPDSQEWSRYQCPVCGHRDRVTVAGAEASWIQCSHCDTLLEVKYQNRLSESVSVRVVLDRDQD